MDPSIRGSYSSRGLSIRRSYSSRYLTIRGSYSSKYLPIRGCFNSRNLPIREMAPPGWECIGVIKYFRTVVHKQYCRQIKVSSTYALCLFLCFCKPHITLL